MDILTPDIEVVEIPGEQSSRAKILERLLQDVMVISELMYFNSSQTAAWNKMIEGSLNRTKTLEWVIVNVIADGLSREGSVRVLNIIEESTSWPVLDYHKITDFFNQLLRGGKPLKKPPSDVPLIKTRTAISISGYSYKASVTTNYFSIDVHLVYMLLASSYTVQLVFRRRVSACWDGITEFFAFAQNSEPAMKALKNTCAGVGELRTYAQLAAIRVVQPKMAASTTQIPHLELIFHEEPEDFELTSRLNDSTLHKNFMPGAHSMNSESGFRNLFDLSLSSRREMRPPDEVQWRRRKKWERDSRLSKVEADTVYG